MNFSTSLSSCPYFGVCGGCSLHHLAPDEYKTYKYQKVVKALEEQAIFLKDTLIHPLESIPLHSRRRVVLKAHKRGKTFELGFYQAKSHKIVNIKSCLIAVPEISDFITPLNTFLNQTFPLCSKAEIFLTFCDQGLDISIKFSPPSFLTLEQRERAILFVKSQKISRFIIDNEPLYISSSPTVTFAGFPVETTPEAFLQSSKASDEWLANKVCSAFSMPAKKIADLFCGRGTLTLPLSRLGATIHAYEMDVSALKALQKTISHYRLSITLHHQHLFQDPLTKEQLKLFDGVVINPPREGALNQSKHLAVSQVKQIIMVSCNPTSFARDARILLNGSYQLREVYLLDQFLGSPHVEVVAIFKLSE